MTVGEEDQQQFPGEVPNYPPPTGAPAPGYAPPAGAPAQGYAPAAGAPAPGYAAPTAGEVPNYPPPESGDLYYAPQHHNYDGAPRLGNGFRPEMVEGNWSDGFWNMCGEPHGCQFCCYALWCSCCVFGQNYALYHEDTTVDTNSCAMVCTGPCWLQWAIGFIPVMFATMLGIQYFVNPFVFILPCWLRGEMRKKYGIEGPDTYCCPNVNDLGDDFISTFCCGLCADIQMWKTLKSRQGLQSEFEVVGGGMTPSTMSEDLASDDLDKDPFPSTSHDTKEALFGDDQTELKGIN